MNKKKKIVSLVLALILLLGTSMVFGDVGLEGNEPVLGEVLEDLLDYYDDYSQYNFRQASGLHWASDDSEYIKKIHTRFLVRDNGSATNCASNIIGLLAAGYDPADADGIDYIEILVNSQNSEGKFLIDSWDDYPTSTAYSILALDMAEADYNQDQAITALLTYQNQDGSFGAFPDVDTTAMSLMALGEYHESPGVPEAVNKGLAYIQSKQLDSGGFSPGYKDWETGEEVTEENPYSTCTVIQALVANGIDPFHEEWTKNGKNMVDALLAYQSGQHFQFGLDIEMLTEQVLCALADVYRDQSMYQGISLNPIEVETFELKRIGSGPLTKGAEGQVTVQIKNDTPSSEEATLIIGLFDLDTQNMVYYNYFTKEYLSQEAEEITNAFLVPVAGNYSLKIFLWDNITDMNIKATPISIDIE